MVPDFATHYHVPSRPPFLNLSDLEGAELRRVIGALQSEHRAGQSRRLFGMPYVELRRQAESRLLELFEAAGGVAKRSAPHYFVLGESAWFRGLSPSMCEIRVALGSLPPESTSVTFWDSFAAMGVGGEHGIPRAPDEFFDRVFRLSDLPSLVSTHGMPSGGADYDDYHLKPMNHFVEIQLWIDDPIAEQLSDSLD